MILAAAALLSLGTGSSFAATNGLSGYTQKNYSADTGTTITATTSAQTAAPLTASAVPNPWQGTESWNQWNKDHPLVGGD
jgi:hypothetical protein